LPDREDGRMAFAARSAHELYNRWRGFQPWPGAFTVLDGKKLIVHRLTIAAPSNAIEPHLAQPVPGRISIDDHRLFVACAGSTWLELLEIQLEGKKRLAVAEFLRGTAFAPAARLG
jgi:methionyl-tRNA formyltransferase